MNQAAVKKLLKSLTDTDMTPEELKLRGDPDVDNKFLAVSESHVTIRRIASGNVAQKALMGPVTIPGAPEKPWRPRENKEDKPDPGLKEYLKRLEAWISGMKTSVEAFDAAKATMDALSVPSKPEEDDSDYFACIGAALRDVRGPADIPGAPAPDRTLLVAGDFILGARQDDFAKGEKPAKGVNVIIYSDCTRSTAFEPPNGHLQGKARSMHCAEIEEAWKSCFLSWGASDVNVVRAGEPNPFLSAHSPPKASTECSIRNQIPKG